MAVQQLPTKNVIWQYWAQGFDEDKLPEIVNICIKSVDTFKGDYTVIRLCDENINQYLDLPDFIVKKKQLGIINHTFFSDILRVALLSSYGGVWLDATILLSDKLSINTFKNPYFVYQRDPSEQNKSFWEGSYAFYWGWNPKFKVNMLNSIFFSIPGHVVVQTITDLLFAYWKEENKAIDYFMFQILYDVLMEKDLKDHRCAIDSDVNPHLLQTKFNGSADFLSYETIESATKIHKLSYFNEQAMHLVRSFVSRRNVIH